MSIFRRRLMIAAAQRKSDGNIHYPGLIAAWSAKGKSNDDADRAVLRDLTGNGHDLLLNNFAFSEMSGYGGYNVNLLKIGRTSANLKEKTATKIVVNGKKLGYILYNTPKSEVPSYKVKLTGLVTEYAYVDENDVRKIIRIGEGIHVLPKSHASSTVTISCGFLNPVTTESTENGTIELLPEYPDALVFDGMDDYCDCAMVKANLFKENFTIICKREYITEPSIAHRMTTANCRGANTNATIFTFEGFYNNPYISVYSPDLLTYDKAPVDYSLNTVFLTPTNYNGHTFKHSGYNNYEDDSKIMIGGLYTNTRYANMAFHSAWLFDRSLDEQEIKSFIRKYIDADYLLPSETVTPAVYYDFTNGDNAAGTRDTIVDLSGNGNDAKAINFAYNEEGSGYKDGALQFDGVADNVALLNPKKFRTVFIVTKWEMDLRMIYGQREMSVSTKEQNNAIYTQLQAYRARNTDGITYLNGKKNTHVDSADLKGKKHCITEIFTNTGTNSCTGTVIGASTGPQHFMKMSLYKFLAFEEELTEAQIQYVIDKYNLLDGVDNIEVG